MSIVISNDVWEKVLNAVGLERESSEPMIKLVVTLENGEPVVVEETKYIDKENGDS